MTQGEAKVEKYQVPLEVYERLAKATPEEKTDIVLRLIEEHPEGRLELPARDRVRANLSKVDLSRDTLRARLAQSKIESPPWWDADHEGANLFRAELQGANLFRAELQGANLLHANLQDANLESTNLQDANLEGANLQGALLMDANLQDAILANTNLQNAGLDFANLQGANLVGVDLQGVILTFANLQGANLIGARLQGVDLSNTYITRIYVNSARLDKTRLRWEQLGGAIGEELAGAYRAAKHGYLALKQNFDDLGDYDAASWAYRKERRMEKLEALQKARTAVAERKWRAAIGNFAKFASDQLVEWMCDYGESVPRVLGSLLVVYVLFTLFYGLTWGVMRVYDTPTAIIKEPTRNLIDLARFSLSAMTTMESAGLEPRNGLVELVARLQALLGVALTGLLGFVVANRIRRS